MEISLQHNIGELTKNIEDQFKRQIPFATHHAMNLCLKQTREIVQNKLNSSFTGIVDKTAKSVLYQIQPHRFAHTPLKDINGIIYLMPHLPKGTAPAKYLQPQIVGGGRHYKSSEKQLQRAGLIKEGEFIIPAKNWQDSNGNIKPGMTTLVLSRLKAFTFADAKLKMNETERSKQRRLSKKVKKATDESIIFYLKERRGRLPKGIYERTKSGQIRAVFFIVGAHNYKVRLPFQSMTEDTFYKLWPTQFTSSLEFAISTAK